MVRYEKGTDVYTYTYNGDGQRLSKTVNGVTTEFTWDGMDMILESSGSVASIYVYGNGINYRKTGSTVYTYTTNAHGDVVNYAQGTTVVKEYCYDAFGNELDEYDSRESENPLRYCGEYYDAETGLYYLRNRYYDPQTGRFITEDAHWNTHNMIYGDGSSSVPDMSAIMQSSNLYTYCTNDPINYKDPTGRAKDGDDRFSQSVRDEIAIFGQVWADAEVAYSLGIINYYEKVSVQQAAESKADAIRYKADHPVKSFLQGAVEFAVFDIVLGDLNGGTVYAADLSGPTLEKMYGNQDNLSSIVSASPMVAVAAIGSSDKGRTLVNTKINGKMTRVDIEFPQGGKPANLHVQIKGTGQKVMIESLDDLAKLPKSVAKNSAIINTVKKGLKMLGKLF